MKKTAKQVSKLRLSRETLRELAETDLSKLEGAGSTPTLPQFCVTGYPGNACTNPLFCIT